MTDVEIIATEINPASKASAALERITWRLLEFERVCRLAADDCQSLHSRLQAVCPPTLDVFVIGTSWWVYCPDCRENFSLIGHSAEPANCSRCNKLFNIERPIHP